MDFNMYFKQAQMKTFFVHPTLTKMAVPRLAIAHPQPQQKHIPHITWGHPNSSGKLIYDYLSSIKSKQETLPSSSNHIQEKWCPSSPDMKCHYIHFQTTHNLAICPTRSVNLFHYQLDCKADKPHVRSVQLKADKPHVRSVQLSLLKL